MLITQLAEEFYAYMRNEKGASLATISAYSYDLKILFRFFEFEGIPPASIDDLTGMAYTECSTVFSRRLAFSVKGYNIMEDESSPFFNFLAVNHATTLT